MLILRCLPPMIWEAPGMERTRMSIYGKDFAAVYNDTWPNFSAKLWPFIAEMVRQRVPEARNWLDLCCGTGRLLEILAREGYSATGLDASPHMLRYARRNAPGARLVRGDVRSFKVGKEFDVITCLFDSLNYLTRKRDLARAFHAARRHLREGGLFLFDLNTFEGLQDRWNRASVGRYRGGLIVVETSFDAKRARGRCHITGFLREGRFYRKFEEEHIQRGYRSEEVDDLLTQSGLAFRNYDGRSLSKPRKRSDRLVYVCLRRP